MENAALTVTADGKKLPLNRFVHRLLLNLVTGLLASLKGVPADPAEIIITVTRTNPGT